MDANDSENNGTTVVSTGLDMVRARAQRQKHVRLTRTVPPDAMSLRTSWHSIHALKIKSADEPEPESDERCFLTRLWSDFQELIGNR